MKIKAILERLSYRELYHVTTYKNAINILNYNYFRPSEGTNGLRGLSTTTDRNYWWGSREVRFVIDKKSIERYYELIDIDEGIYMDDGDKLDESEILIISDSAIKEIDRFIIRIEYVESKDRNYESFIKALNNYKDKYVINSVVLG